MHLERESLDRLTTWVLYGHTTGTDGDVQLVTEFLRTIEDGSWRDRWHRIEDLAHEHGSEQWVVELRPGLRLVLLLDYDGDPDLAQVLSISADGGWAG